MERETILKNLQRVVAENLCVDESKVQPEARFQEDLGADSLDIVELVMELEAEFEIEIPDEESEKLLTVQQAVDYLAGREELA